MPEADDFMKIETRQVPDRDHRRGQWNKEARVDRGPWRYLLGAQKLGSNWIVRVKDVETGEVLTDQSLDLHDNLAVQKQLVVRLHDQH
jgi:hypothetical protein